MNDHIEIGDLIILKDRFTGHGDKCIILEIFKSQSLGDGGWISFTYKAITNEGQVINLTESCIKKVVKNGRDTGI